MKSSAAFSRWLTARGHDPTAILAAVRAADQNMIKLAAAWLREGGLGPVLGDGPVGEPATDNELDAALTLLVEHGVGVAQVAAALRGDVQKTVTEQVSADGQVMNNVDRWTWSLHRTGNRAACSLPLTAPMLAAVRVLAKHNRTVPAGGNEPLLVHANGSAWKPHQIRYRIRRTQDEPVT